MRIRMPWSVRLAALSLASAAAAQGWLVVALGSGRGVGPWKALFATAVFVLLLAGIVRARRLAWLWGRSLGFLLAAGLSGAVFVQAVRGGVEPVASAVLVGGVALPLLVHALALGRRSAFEWFGLVCPSCGATTGRGDLLMSTARCGRCGEAF